MSMTISMTSPILSEEMADAVRRGDINKATTISPYFACLFPLLETLGWKNYQRDLIESLPYFSDHLDLTDLRNVLVNLGYESQQYEGKAAKLDQQLLPALLVGRNDRVVLLLERHGNEYKYFDGNDKKHKTGRLPFRGAIYLFTDTSLSQAVYKASFDAWFSNLVSRFQSLIKHLLGMTFILNLISVCVPLFIMNVYDKIIGSKTLDALPYFVAGISIALIVELCLRFLRATTLATVAGRIDYLIGKYSFKQITDLPPIFTEQSSVSAQLSKLREFDSIRDFFTGQSATLLLDLPFVLLFIFLIALLAGWLAVIPCVVAVIYILFSTLWLPRMRKHLKHSAKSRTLKEQMLMETFNGLHELKAMGAEETWLDRYKVSTADSASASRASSIDQAVLQSVTNTLMLLSATAILIFGTHIVMAGDMSVGALIAVMTLSWRVLVPLQGICLSYFRLETVLTGIQNLNRLMAIKVEQHGRKSALMSKDIKGQIKFERVSFKYGPKYDPVLLGVSFSVPAKAFVAIVGHNGSGKSTLIKLINGLYPMQAGTVSIDGIDTRQFNPNDLRRLVGYVPQNPSLFRGTIEQNIRMKDPLATQNDIKKACQKTGILSMIESLPDGFKTIVGDENTARLPCSLVRGICIARAFVGNSPILLLDEPGSGLDSESDDALMQQLQAIKHHFTVIMISHRPSHIRIADRVLELERGVLKRIVTPNEYYAKSS